MHITKHFLYLSIIVYCAVLVIFQDWYAVTAATGRADFFFLAKIGLDALLALMAGVLWAGPGLFTSDDDDDEEVVVAEDLHISDTLLLAIAMVNIAGNFIYHIFLEINTSDFLSGSYYLVWLLGEASLFVLTWLAWNHAKKMQKKAAKRARQAAAPAAEEKPPIRRAS